ncbi:MAG: glycerophosphodiester phosphodiesterase family protein [Chitinophagales bacterium]
MPLFQYGQDPKIIAHRGASGYCPENTIPAIEKALEIGVDMVEIDIHLSKDGEIIVIHDATIDRTTNGKGYVVDFTLNELKEFDAGSWYDEKFSGTKIPELSEVLQLCVGKCPLLIEVKKGSDYYPEIEQKAWQLVKEMNAEEWVEFQSFYDHSLEQMEKTGITAPIYKLLVGIYPGFPLYIDHSLKWGNYFRKNKVSISGINPNESFVNSAFLNKVNNKSLSSYIWTVNEEKKMRKMIARNVAGIITNYPKELKQILNE